MPQFPDDDIVGESEYNNYHFNPVIENREENVYNEDCSFQRLEIPSNNSQQFKNEISIPPTSSFGDVFQKETTKNFLQCDQPISDNCFGKSNNFTQVLIQQFKYQMKLGLLNILKSECVPNYLAYLTSL